jgi:hypothetical protein
MPIHDLGGGCYRWGASGHKYCGPGAREKAMRQMRAEFYNGYKGASIDAGDIAMIEAENKTSYDALAESVDDHIIAAYLATETTRIHDGAKPSETKARIQCVHFAKSMFTAEQAKAWLDKRGLKSDLVESDDKISWYAKQQELTATSKYRTTRFSQGINVTLAAM